MRNVAGSSAGAAPRAGPIIPAPRRSLLAVRCAALPIGIDSVGNIISSLSQSAPLPSLPSLELLNDPRVWHNLPPHFGSRAFADAAEALAARASSLAPSLPPPLDFHFPQLDSAAALEGALAPLTAAAAAGLTSSSFSLPSSLSDPTTLLERLPHLADPGLFSTASAPGSWENLTQALQNSVQAAAAVVESAAVATGAQLAAAAAAAANDVVDGRAVRDVGSALTAAAEALSSGELPPHFGTAAAAAAVQAAVAALSHWAAALLAAAGDVAGGGSRLELLDPEAAAALTSALGELRSVAGLMTVTLPPVVAVGGNAVAAAVTAAG
ncbi:hypothetical protein Agub_g4362, partial [Astrephomene gubernaculifera]